ncbi:MAG: hypothetical protein WCY19_03835 [Candidatus Gastranaerophilaceae bacterium]
MKNKITTENLIQQYFTPDEAQKLHKEIDEAVEKIKWGGKRKNAGRKTKIGIVLSFTARLTTEEKEFIEYSRKNNLHLRELMQG